MQPRDGGGVKMETCECIVVRFSDKFVWGGGVRMRAKSRLSDSSSRCTSYRCQRWERSERTVGGKGWETKHLILDMVVWSFLLDIKVEMLSK